MKLEKIEGSENYCVTVVKLPPKQKVEGLDKLCKVTVFGNDVLTKKDANEEQLYLFFPAECQISSSFLFSNNEFRNTLLNKDQTQKGYFEDSGRVKAIKFKGVISTGYLTPLNTLLPLVDIKGFKVGDEFNTINGHVFCKKYKIVHQHVTAGQQKESKFNKKLKRFSKLVPNQFRFHVSTSHLAKNLHMFQPEDIICITDKWHGTSGVFSNVLINKQLTWKEKFAKWLGIEVVQSKYDNLYSSRTVVKNQYINTDVTPGFYGEDIWAIVNKELDGKIEQGITLYGEIVGYLPSGKVIQKGYDYGCKDGEHKFLVYRITYTKPDGNVIEFSWQQIKDYSKKYSIETVKELYFGVLDPTFYKEIGLPLLGEPNTLREELQTHWFNSLCETYLEKDCNHCINKVPAEGIVVRRDGLDHFAAYKLKAKRFLERETKQLDEEAKTGEVNIEDESSH